MHQFRISVSFLLHALILLTVWWLGTSCTPEEERWSNETDVQLLFSADTIRFDTVFSGQGSISKRFRAYNTSRNAINIQSISMAEGSASNYELIVNGQIGQEFANIRLLGGDSLLVVVRVFPPAHENDEPQLDRDEIVFEVGNKSSRVIVESWGQDVIIFNARVFDEDVVFRRGRPYLLSNSILIEENVEAVIEAGARFFSERESFIIIAGNLQANGTAEEPIVFANSRLDRRFINSSGQWGGIVVLETAQEVIINHAIIRNALFGINHANTAVPTNPQLTVRNTRIFNMTLAGIISLGSHLLGENLLITNCGESAIRMFGGGIAQLNHCTFALFPYERFRDEPVLLVNDAVRDNSGRLIANPLNFTVQNSIIWGNRADEIEFLLSGENEIIIAQSHNLWRSTLNELAGNNSLLNQNPLFIKPAENNYGLSENSPARQAGTISPVQFDLFGKPLANPPDLGAIAFDAALID
jgi:hypothetical protein